MYNHYYNDLEGSNRQSTKNNNNNNEVTLISARFSLALKKSIFKLDDSSDLVRMSEKILSLFNLIEF